MRYCFITLMYFLSKFLPCFIVSTIIGLIKLQRLALWIFLSTIVFCRTWADRANTHCYPMRILNRQSCFGVHGGVYSLPYSLERAERLNRRHIMPSLSHHENVLHNLSHGFRKRVQILKLHILEYLSHDALDRTKTLRTTVSTFMHSASTAEFYTFDLNGTANNHKDSALDAIFSIARAADNHKAENIIALNTSLSTPITDYMIIMHCRSYPQMNAVADAIEEKTLKEHGLHIIGRDGKSQSGWIVLDLGRIFVHIMTPMTRYRYNLEELYKEAEAIDLSHVLLPSVPEGYSIGKQALSLPEYLTWNVTSNITIDKEDPFWS